MAKPGINFELSEESKNQAIRYVEESGFYKNRLADFLGISRPTLNKLLEEDSDFFTAIKAADAVFCKNLIEVVKRKNPIFILRTKYRDEFNEKGTIYDPEIEIKRVKALLEESCTKEIVD